MTEGLYQWVENIAFYMVFMTAALHLIPGDGYRKYLKFFTGLLLILLVLSPVLKIAGMEKTFREMFEKYTYEEELQRIEKKTKYLEEVSPEDYLPKAYGGNDEQSDGAHGEEPGNDEQSDRTYEEESGDEKEGGGEHSE